VHGVAGPVDHNSFNGTRTDWELVLIEKRDLERIGSGLAILPPTILRMAAARSMPMARSTLPAHAI
jgi:hypothetical protein